MNGEVFLTGLLTGMGLILAIGAQNAFVLRQGLARRHVAPVVAVCALSDAVLIAAGVAGAGTLTARLPWLDPVMRLAGAAFLIAYGARSLRAALRADDSLTVGGPLPDQSLRAALLTCLAITWLNPHVYLDTVVLLGAISTQFPGGRVDFAAGAMTGSVLFFTTLGYGAAWLRPVFASPRAWRRLEFIIALIMWAIAARLLAGFRAG